MIGQPKRESFAALPLVGISTRDGFKKDQCESFLLVNDEGTHFKDLEQVSSTLASKHPGGENPPRKEISRAE